MKRFVAILSVTALMLGMGLAAAHEPAKTPMSNPSPALTPQGLGTMIEGMGLSPQEGKYANGNLYFDIKMAHDGWDMPIRLALSPNGKVLWLHLNLVDLPAMDQVPAERLVALLQKNGSSTGKAMFCVRGKTLWLMQPVDNHHLTPARLLAELQDLCAVGKSHEPDYNPKNWTSPTKAGVVQK